jgi:hypothetical protein
MNTALKIIDDICEGGKKPNRENILAFEKAAKDLPQVEIPITHHIHGGMYGRESTIKKGFVVTGQIYKFDHFDIMVSGDITVTTDTGESKRLTGFNLIKCMSGKKRAAYTHEDTIWITMHPFSGSNGDDIQDFITVDTFDELAVFKSTINKADYLSFVDSVGISKEDIRTLAETTSDLIPMPVGYESIYVDNSDIEGQGLYSKENIREGSVICPGRINGKRTPAGRYTNHALLHNAEMFFSGDDIELRAIKNIEKGEEITMNYRNVINARYERGEL